jgi:hypothetical protein
MQSCVRMVHQGFSGDCRRTLCMQWVWASLLYERNAPAAVEDMFLLFASLLLCSMTLISVVMLGDIVLNNSGW